MRTATRFTLAAATAAASLIPLSTAAHAALLSPDLRISASVPSPPASPPTWLISPGDTVWMVATDWQRTVDQVAGFNRLADSSLVLVGQVLTDPPPGYVPPAPPAPAPAPLRTVRAPVVHTPAAVAYAAPRAPVRAPVVVHTVTAAAAPTSGFEACVIARESGGNSQVMNSSGHYGLYQFSYSTWVANGGSPSSFGHASPGEQHAVFSRSAPSNWQPYDGC